MKTILDRIFQKSSGWKSILGLVGYVMVMGAEELGWIDSSFARQLEPLCASVFGIGIIHKVVKSENRSKE